MVLVTVSVCGAFLDAKMEGFLVSKMERLKIIYFKRRKIVKIRVFSRAMAMLKPWLQVDELVFMYISVHLCPCWVSRNSRGIVERVCT